MKKSRYEHIHVFDGEEVVRRILPDGDSMWVATFKYEKNALDFIKMMEELDKDGDSNEA